MVTHAHLDERSLAMHRLVAEKLRRDPALLFRARGGAAASLALRGHPDAPGAVRLPQALA
jgi:hypothetical protein